MALESMRLMCQECGYLYDDLIERAHRDEWHTCPACGEQSMRRMLAAPNVRTRQSASYIDGTKRFGTVRESNQLKRAFAEAKKAGDKETMKDVKKEQSKLGAKE